MAGVVAAVFGLVWAVHVAGVLTLLSGLLAWAVMNETRALLGGFDNWKAVGQPVETGKH